MSSSKLFGDLAPGQDMLDTTNARVFFAEWVSNRRPRSPATEVNPATGSERGKQEIVFGNEKYIGLSSYTAPKFPLADRLGPS